MNLRTVQQTYGTRRAPARKTSAPLFFDTYSPLILDDSAYGFSRTDAGDLGDLGVANIVSTGHKIGVVEQDCISLLVPVSGRILSETPEGTLGSRRRGALVFWPNRRATRVEPGAGQPFRAAAFRIPQRALLASADRHDRRLASRVLDANIAASLDPDRMSGVGMLTDYCQAVLAEAERPNSLLDRQSARDRACAQITETLVEVLAACGALPEAEDRPDRLAMRRVRAAEDYMRSDFAEISSMGDVCRAVDTSLRVLQLAFATVRGETPRQALAAIRLDAARDRLSSPSEDETVTGVALDCGLSHLGRFAVAYRERFGESPSTTLERARGG